MVLRLTVPILDEICNLTGSGDYDIRDVEMRSEHHMLLFGVGLQFSP
jgi:hypothetical protein